MSPQNTKRQIANVAKKLVEGRKKGKYTNPNDVDGLLNELPPGTPPEVLADAVEEYTRQTRRGGDTNADRGLRRLAPVSAIVFIILTIAGVVVGRTLLGTEVATPSAVAIATQRTASAAMPEAPDNATVTLTATVAQTPSLTETTTNGMAITPVITTSQQTPMTSTALIAPTITQTSTVTTTQSITATPTVSLTASAALTTSTTVTPSVTVLSKATITSSGAITVAQPSSPSAASTSALFTTTQLKHDVNFYLEGQSQPVLQAANGSVVVYQPAGDGVDGAGHDKVTLRIQITKADFNAKVLGRNSIIFPEGHTDRKMGSIQGDTPVPFLLLKDGVFPLVTIDLWVNLRDLND